jgi:hypothetical protein
MVMDNTGFALRQKNKQNNDNRSGCLLWWIGDLLELVLALFTSGE